MAAKSILNELYQRLRTAAPIYRTQADNGAEGFLCTLTLPAVDCTELGEGLSALGTARHFTGRGCSKKEAEHAAAIAAVELLTAERILKPDVPAGSHSRGTATASPSISSATSGVSLPGVGSKRTQSNTDLLEDDSAESLELRIVEALTAAYPKPLNGAQLAKLCGHFKLKSKVNHLLYMKLKAQGLVELLDTPTPAWRAAGRALTAAQATAGLTQQAQHPASTAVLPAAAAMDGAACSKEANWPAGQQLAGRAAVCASGREGAAAGAGSSAAVTSSTTISTAGPPASDAGGEVSSAAAHVHLAAGQAGAATAGGGLSTPGIAGAHANSQRQSLQNSPQAATQPSSLRASKGATMSPAASSSGVLGVSRPAASGGGVRGSCSPVPAAMYGRRHPVQQQATIVQPSTLHSSRATAAPYGLARHRRQHAQQLGQQQQEEEDGWLPAGLRSGAPRSPSCNPAAQRVRLQHAGAAAAMASEALGVLQQQQLLQQQLLLRRHQHQQQQQLETLAQSAGVEALLLPQTLAAVAGLGLFDHSDAARMPAARAAAAASSQGLRMGSPCQAHSAGALGTQHAQHTASFGQILSQGSQELGSGLGSGQLQAHSNPGLQQQQAAATSQQAAAARRAAAAAPGGVLQGCRQGNAASDSDEEISPAVLAAASEAASLEPAPFDEQRQTGSTGSFQQHQDPPQWVQQQQQQPQWVQQHRQGLPQQWCGTADHALQVAASAAAGAHFLGQHVDLLAAMHIHEQPPAQQYSTQPLGQQQDEEGPCTADAVVPQSFVTRARGSNSGRAPGEAGIKRKYPVYLSTEEGAAADAAAGTPPHGHELPAAAAVVGALRQVVGRIAAASGAGIGAAYTAGGEDAQAHEQQGGLQQQQQQQRGGPDADQVHPQRRRRRSGQAGGFSGRGLGGLAAEGGAVVDGVGRTGAGRGGGLGAGEDEHTGSSDDMRDWEEGVAGADVTAAGVPESMQESRQQQQPVTPFQRQPRPCSLPAVAQLQQQQWQQQLRTQLPGSEQQQVQSPGWEQQQQLRLQPLGGEQRWLASMWPDQGPTGSNGNPWQWQGQQQAWQQGRQALGPVGAADSEGNGSCLSWPAAAAGAGATSKPTAGRQQLLQQPAAFAGAVRELSGGADGIQDISGLLPVGARPVSPGPCMSGLSVGASAVSGGYRGSVEPLPVATAAAAAAGGQEVTQPPPQALQQQGTQLQHTHQQPQQQQQQQQPAAEQDLQSEEQALQLLSRLALPPAGCLPGPAADASTVQHAATTAEPGAHSGVATAAAAGLAAAGAQVATPGSVGATGDCLTVAMAAAAAAAQAAAAVASAAGIVAAEPSAQAAQASIVAPGVADAAVGMQGPPQPLALGANGPVNESGLQQQQQQQSSRDLRRGWQADGDAAGSAAVGVGVDAVTALTAGATGGGASGEGHAVSGIAPAELQAEYERRVGQVQQLVQQLNEALQGLTNLQGQVGRPGVGAGLQQQQSPP